MDVNEIFYSIEGEGIRAGFPCVFVRFNGCNLNCSYCDTKYAQKKTKTDMPVEAILQEVLSYGCPYVTLTGGEPLQQPDISRLVSKLLGKNLEINIETNGSISPRDVLDNLLSNKKVIITMDYKCTSSGMSSRMLLSNFMSLYTQDVLKFVVGTHEDLEEALRVINILKLQGVTPNIFFSPVFGQIEPKEIVEFLKTYGLTQCRVQLQLHKFIWPPEERGV